MKNLILITVIISALFSCGQPKVKSTPVEIMEQAHRKNSFLKKDILKYDLQLFFGGNERLNVTITTLTNSTKAIISLNDSSQIMVDGSDVYYSSNYKKVNSVRFDAYTWNYFTLFPYKLSDPGTIWSSESTQDLNETTYNFQTLTFKANTGDDPDDWYKVYSDQKTHLIKAAAYIVTAGKTKEEAEKDPHAIEYTNYLEVDSIPLATKWTFWGWQEDKGLTDKLGSATLSNFEFLSNQSVSFDIPTNFIKE